MRNDGGPAFPACNEANVNDTMGMTLRDYFAGQALLGIAATQVDDDLTIAQNAEVAANWAYCFADAMINERKRRQP